MKVIFSRKGFDSASGGVPSPIIDGRPISIPIPVQSRSHSHTTYGELGLGKLVDEITKSRLTANSLCHHDPMFENGRCAFGQHGAAQGHLRNNDVGAGDVFLFFGLFSNQDTNTPHHRIFGFLKVDTLMPLGTSPGIDEQPEGFTQRHPHTIGIWDANNTLYIGHGMKAKKALPKLRLTHPDGPLTRWTAPRWLSDTGLTYHANPKRWLADGTLISTSRGQEFVADITGNRKAKYWLTKTIDMLSTT